MSGNDAWTNEADVEASGLTSQKKRHQSWAQKLSTMSKDDVKHTIKDGWDWVIHPAGRSLLGEIKDNIKPGITVSLVNIPLSISLAIAGGGAPAAGIVTAFWAGIVSALLGGSHFNIVGPTGALSGVLASSAAKYGAEVLPLLSIMAGILCFIVWILKIDKYVMFIPSSVIHGFTLGVAFIIGLNQLNSALGLTGLPAHEKFLENVWESLKNIGHSNIYAVIFFIINFSALFALVKKWPKFPWAIVIACVGILVGFCTTKNYIPIDLLTLEGKYGELKLSLVTIPKFSGDMFAWEVFSAAFATAFIAILETLISARIADAMTKTKHSQRREVFAISISNIICGTLGGIPATAALARTALNIKSGATSRIAAIINCIFVAILGLVVLPLFKFIPMATIAALLVMVAFRMIDFHHLSHMYRYDKKMFLIALLSAVTCLAIDTMVGILVGGVVSLLLFVDQMSVGHSEVHLNKGTRNLSAVDLTQLEKSSPRVDGDSLEMAEAKLPLSPTNVPDQEEFDDTLVYRITGQLTFVNSLAHVENLSLVADGVHNIKNVIISLRYLHYIDLDGTDALREVVEKLKARGIRVLFSGVMNGNVPAFLAEHGFFKQTKEEGLIFSSYLAALQFVHGTQTPSSVEPTVALKEEDDHDHHTNIGS